MAPLRSLAVGIAVFALACGGGGEAAYDGPEAISLLGDSLYPSPAPAEARAQQEAELAAALTALEHAPDDVDSIIWAGRRLAYLGRYREAIDMYTRGVASHPGDARLYRHRGHRYITRRSFDRAIADLTKAAQLVAGRPDEVEPDGQPNERGIPTGTLQSNIWYHLGLAHYLTGDFARAESAYRECMKVSANPDMLVATSYWLYMTLRRLGKDAEAAQVLRPIVADMDIIENDAYHRLLLMYKGRVSADSLWSEARAGSALQSATMAYGIGNWHSFNGRADRAQEIFRAILESPQWAAFGYIAAEAELAR